MAAPPNHRIVTLTCQINDSGRYSGRQPDSFNFADIWTARLAGHDGSNVGVGLGGSGGKDVDTSPAVFLAVAGACLGGTTVAFLAGNFELEALLPLFTPKEASFCRGTLSTRQALVLSCFLPIPLGILVVNALAWLIPPARRALRMAEARVGIYRSLIYPLGAVAFGVPVALLCAGSSVCLSPAALHYRANSLAAPQVYDLSQIETVRLSCSISKKGVWEARLVVAMHDGKTFNLETASLGMLHHRSSFSFPQISDALRDRPLDSTGIEPDCPHKLKRLFSPGR